MKTFYLILTVLISMQLSCTTTEDNENSVNSLIGKWKLVEVFDIYGGSSDSPWIQVEDGYFYIFKENGTIETDKFDCIGNFIYNTNDEYQLNLTFNCSNHNFSSFYKVIFENNFITLEEKDSSCDEGCAEKFQRI